MRLVVEPLGQLKLGLLHDDSPCGARELAAGLVAEDQLPDIDPAGNRVSHLGRQNLSQAIDDGVLIGQRHDVGGRTLQHGDVAGVGRHRRNQRHGGGAGADHDHLLALVVQVFGPVLWVHHGAFEIGHPGELRRVALVVVVVPTAAEQEGTGVFDGLAIVIHLNGPLLGFGVPGSADNLLPVPHVPVNTGVGRRLVHVVQDRRTIGQGPAVVPRREPEAQGVHVRVGANTRVLEEVPGAAHVVAGFKHRVGLGRAAILDMPRGTDPGDTCTDNEHVKVFGHAAMLPLTDQREK
ncbi:Uncharacterised protein [Mycobacteroides abscessus subsp. abscessus]|nr:Uncharacterised protein [Mycobacteroides abscessus subsp. abscessus]